LGGIDSGNRSALRRHCQPFWAKWCGVTSIDVDGSLLNNEAILDPQIRALADVHCSQLVSAIVPVIEIIC
jgi:hypothetical protein